MADTWLSALTLSYFRSHQRTELALDGRPVAIYGPNGAGKTNILEAVSILSPGRGLRRVAASDMARRPADLGWKVSAEVHTGGLAHGLVAWSENGAARQVTVDDKAASQAALGRLLRVIWLVPVMDRLWVEGADGRRRFLDRLTLGFDPAHGEAVLTYEKAMRERNRLLKEGVSDPAWYRALEAQMAESGARIATARIATVARLTSSQDGAVTAFPLADLALSGPDGTGASAGDSAELAMALQASRGADLRAGRTLVGPHRDDLVAIYAEKGVPARDCSTGEQKALLVSLVLASARALKEDTGLPPLLLLDEVAAHLDAGRRAALYDEICALGIQAWMTGTGPELFDDLGDRAQRIEVTDSGEGSLALPA
ncbi:MAG: DNA replication/repair protein RecF [Pseudomonadota bacterium]